MLVQNRAAFPEMPVSDLSAVWSILAVVLVIVGIAGTILPALPGIPLVFGGLLLAAWADGFRHVGGWTLAILVLLTLASFAIDLLATAMGAKRVGGGRRARHGAPHGALAGGVFGSVGRLRCSANSPIAGAWRVPTWAMPRASAWARGRGCFSAPC